MYLKQMRYFKKLIEDCSRCELNENSHQVEFL